MCLAALSVDQHRRYPFVLAANRDEYYRRPTARMGWWLLDGGGPVVLGGRDLQAGGSWCALSAEGRLALVTNVRRPGSMDPGAPSRGAIVARWLRGDEPSSRFWVQIGLEGYNPFNLVAFDFTRDERFWCGAEAAPRRLDSGLFGVSNALLDTPWPKVVALKAATRSALAATRSPQGLADRLFAALADPAPCADEDLPRTGIPLDRERSLSSAFVRMPGPTPELGYGTRSSIVVIVERTGARTVTHLYERSWRSDGSLEALRHAVLPDWPPAPNAPRWSVDSARMTETEYPSPLPA
ncbi:NRDE family protein [Aquincola sp. MAHUQ-54]|uniref:NRDE family protein n=1 Tax=Aquincola agrisoli TaxID=3119538 RepID=A0AAW9QI84_9BURK